jgi:hypothetical protein
MSLLLAGNEMKSAKVKLLESTFIGYTGISVRHSV